MSENKTSAAASVPESPEIRLPDGIGLSLEQARLLVAKVHG